MTNKLLTLEEIEKIERDLRQLKDRFASASYEAIMRTVATARAYWELKNKPVGQHSYTIELNKCAGCGKQLPLTNMAWTHCNDCQLSVKPEDKPHAPTIRAIEGYNQEKNAIASRMAIMSRSGQGEASYRLREIDKAIQSLVALNPSSKT